LTLLKDTWEWRRWGKVIVDLHISFGVPDSQTSTFRILRHFQSGKDGSVRLVITEQLCLAVLKSHFEEAMRCKEVQLWKELYNVRTYSADLLRSKVMVMPFTFHCVHDPNSDTNVFNFNLAFWGTETCAFAEDTDGFDLWTTRFQDYAIANDLTPENVATRAMEVIAEKGFVHRDVAWRHVALLPIISKDEVIELRPVLIDLAAVDRADSKSDALMEMREQIDLFVL
jgi:hypothetical protein